MDFLYTKNSLNDQSSPRYCLYFYAKFCKTISRDCFNHELREWKLTSKRRIKILFRRGTFSLVKRFLILSVFFLALFFMRKTSELAVILWARVLQISPRGFLQKYNYLFKAVNSVKSVVCSWKYHEVYLSKFHEVILFHKIIKLRT